MKKYLIIVLVLSVFGCGLIKKDPEVDYSKKAAEAFLANRFDEAIEFSKKALLKNPKDVKAQYYLACSYAKKENYEMARKEFEKVIGLDPESSWAKMVKKLGCQLYKKSKQKRNQKWCQKR